MVDDDRASLHSTEESSIAENNQHRLVQSQSQPVLGSSRPISEGRVGGYIRFVNPVMSLDAPTRDICMTSPAATRLVSPSTSYNDRSAAMSRSLSLSKANPSIYTSDDSQLTKEEAWTRLQKQMGSLSNAVTGQVSKKHVRLKLPSAGMSQSSEAAALSSITPTPGVADETPKTMKSHNANSVGMMMPRRRTK